VGFSRFDLRRHDQTMILSFVILYLLVSVAIGVVT
jgi:hypothetical protein